jgi:hypothetical protein
VSPAVTKARGEAEAEVAGEGGCVHAAAARGVPGPARSRLRGGAPPSPAASPRLRFLKDPPPLNTDGGTLRVGEGREEGDPGSGL